MRDFSKWEAMWDAYYAQGFSGGAVPGSAASICWNIGLLLTILAGIIIIVCMGSVIDPTTEGTSAVILPGAVFLIGMVLTFASFALPSHTPQPLRSPSLSAQITTTWNLDDLGECRNGGQKLPESRLEDGDWKCVAYTDIQRTELTVHIKGDKVGLYKADGKALAAKGKDE